MTKEKRIEAAYRLRSRASAEKQARRRQQQGDTGSGNAIAAKNGSFDYKTKIRIVDGFPVEYSCKNDPRGGGATSFNSANLKTMTIHFDYEMVTAPLANFTSNLRALEWSILWNVAQSIGLRNCNFQSQESYFSAGQQQRRLQSAFSTAGNVAPLVVSLSSLGPDQVDNSTGKKYCPLTN